MLKGYFEVKFSDMCDWKQTFYMNLISQVSCALTVSICSRRKDARNGSTFSLCTDKSETAEIGPEKQGMKMISSKRIVKKVFAGISVYLTLVPYKYRMDVKEVTVTNEYSFPLVYYAVHDFEDANLNLEIKEEEYLCVELSVAVPKEPTTAGYQNATAFINEITVEEDASPFPLPKGYTKVVLFQGAVSFSALSETFQQKGMFSENQRSSSWIRSGVSEPRTEYIIMRGPLGKGQCQVAIKETPLKDKSEDKVPIKNPLGSLFGMIKSTLSNSVEPQKKISSLLASITYVNIPWQNLANDFLEFAKRSE